MISEERLSVCRSDHTPLLATYCIVCIVYTVIISNQKIVFWLLLHKANIAMVTSVYIYICSVSCIWWFVYPYKGTCIPGRKNRVGLKKTARVAQGKILAT